MAELWDIYDASGKKTGEVVERSNEPLKDGQYHLVVHIWIYNDRGEMLIQKRADHVYWEPGRWAATGGSAISGEDSITAAIRETEEELGITLAEENLTFITRQVSNTKLLDIWIAKITKSLDQITMESSVTDVKFVTHDELLQMIAEGSHIDYTKGEEYTDETMRRILAMVK